MSKIQIYYFSGTGNTFLVIDKLAKCLRELGHTVEATSCEKTEIIDVSCDILGIAYPIHSSVAPKIFSEFIDKLPNENNKPLFGVVTSGYMAGDVLSYESKSIIKKGYKPILFRNIVVANNLHLPILCPLKVTKQQTIRKRLKRIDYQVKDIAMKIDKGIIDIRGNGSIGKIFGVSQRLVGRRHEKINFKGFTTSENCIKCEWCIRNCPTQNIMVKDKEITFGDNCILCMRCYNFCPKEAIQVTNKTKNIKKYKRYKGPIALGNKTSFN